jgi:D-alanyl-D-alanine carboxypeptidase (penicillin-binding protein 5/6)
MTKRILILLFVLMAGALPASAKHHHHSAASPSPSPTPDEDDSANPRLGPDGAPITHATSEIVLDARTGQELCEKNADERRPCASTQKLLTGLIVAEAGNLDKPVTVDVSDTWAEPVKLNIQPGETYRRFDLLQVMLVHSMNDVARCLARDNAGSVEAFADRMNHKAAELGMTQSHFVNPNGLPIPDQYTTARDMSKVALAAYHNPILRSIVCLKEVEFTYADGRVRKFETTNHVLLKYPLCNGMKTGYTDAAGHCLISSASNGSRDVISVVLGDNGYVWKDSYALLEWGLAGGASAKIGSSSKIGAAN